MTTNQTQERSSAVGLTGAANGLTGRDGEPLTVFAVDLVRAVNTVSDAIALPAAVDAAAVFTLELVRSAGSRGYGRR